MATGSTGGSTTAQAALWGRGASDWPEWIEVAQQPLFVTVLDALELRPGMRLLDIGCGSGEACQLAAARGADVALLPSPPTDTHRTRARVAAHGSRTYMHAWYPSAG